MTKSFTLSYFFAARFYGSGGSSVKIRRNRHYRYSRNTHRAGSADQDWSCFCAANARQSIFGHERCSRFSACAKGGGMPEVFLVPGENRYAFLPVRGRKAFFVYGNDFATATQRAAKALSVLFEQGDTKRTENAKWSFRALRRATRASRPQPAPAFEKARSKLS